MEAHKTIKIKSSDGHVLECNYDALIKENRFFKDMLEDNEIPNEALGMTDQILNKNVLENVLTYCEFAYKNHPPKI